VIRGEDRELLEALGELQATADAGVLELEYIRNLLAGDSEPSENFPGLSDYPTDECDDGAVRNYLVEEQDAGRAAGYVVLAALTASVLSILFVLYLLGS
jgi:hypothetical protein